MNTIPPSLLEPGRGRRRYTKEFKAERVAQCPGLGVSMARVAMSLGINANLLRRWVVESTGETLRAVGVFVWPRKAPSDGQSVTLTPEQFRALVVDLPWERVESLKVISRM